MNKDVAMYEKPVQPPFNPSEHLMQIKNRQGASDYLPVQWRLVWFREMCPHGTIDTEEVEVDLDREMEEEAYAWNNETRRSEKVVKRAKGYARYRAVVTDGKGGRATGTKSEKAVSFPDYIEKAETGAIGRALAALGYGTQFTGDEFDERARIVDAPVDRQESTTSSGPAALANLKTQVDQALGTQAQPGQPAKQRAPLATWDRLNTYAQKAGITLNDLKAGVRREDDGDIPDEEWRGRCQREVARLLQLTTKVS